MTSTMNELDDVRLRYRDQVMQIRGLADVFAEAMSPELDKIGPLLEDKQIMAAIVGAAKNPHDFAERRKGDTISFLAELPKIVELAKLPDEVVRAMQEASRLAQRTRFVEEMVLAHMIAFQEAFVADYLRALFRVRPQILKTKKKLGLTFEKACSFESLDEFKEYLASEDIDPLFYGGIDRVAEYFHNRLNLNLEESSGWEKMREASFRRNIVVHNKGEVNDVYRANTHYNGPAGHPPWDASYLDKVTDATVSFIDFVHEKLSKQMK